MIALDNANRTGDYSVFYALTTPEFQQRNRLTGLERSFSDLRRNRVDIGRSILTTPNYYRQPSIDRKGHLRLRGGFDYRPKSIRFDLLYKQIGGGWRIHAISVVEMDFSAPKN